MCSILCRESLKSGFFNPNPVSLKGTHPKLPHASRNPCYPVKLHSFFDAVRFTAMLSKFARLTRHENLM